MHRILLLITSLNLIACASSLTWLPPQPREFQCGIKNVAPVRPGFYCSRKTADGKGNEHLFLELMDPSMDGGQAMSLPSYKAWESYGTEVQRRAVDHCDK